MDRGIVGTMPSATGRDDESYLEFVEGIRVFNALSRHSVRPTVPGSTGRPWGSPEDIRAVLGGGPSTPTGQRIYRTSQEMMWNGVIDTYGKRMPELVAELDAWDRRGPGSVEWNPNFRYPAYFDRVEFHIQPGNYHADPIAGYIYHYGTKVFFLSRNDQDDVQRTLVNLAPAPSDGVVRRVLDLGCSCGQSTTALKERFPQAQVIGLDLGGPMVRYAHKRAAEMGLDVDFRQGLAEDTGYPDQSFDLVYAFILFHEVPLDIGEKIVREAYRLLRPGGLFVVADFPTGIPRNPNAPPRRDDGGEPYAGDFIASDFHGTLASVFRSVNPNYTTESFLPVRVAEK